MNLGNGKYFLQWNDFEANSRSTFKEMRDDKDFTDITLACDDHIEIEAHKVILASSSLFFDQILRQNKHPHPLIYLRGVKGKDLASILDFIYHGEVNIPQENLEEFMTVAEVLQIKGLLRDPAQESIKAGAGKIISMSKIPNMQQKTLGKSIEIETITELLDDTDIKVSEENVTNSMRIIGGNSFKDFESLDKEIDSLVQATENKGFSCKVCAIEMNKKHHIRVHIEGKHITGFSHPCLKCENGKIYKSRHSLSGHQFKKHRISKD